MTGGYAWPTAQDQIRASLIGLRRTYPVASIWYGETTESWWAAVPGWTRLLEAPDPGGLLRALAEVAVAQSASARPDGSWCRPAAPEPERVVWTERTPRRHTARDGGLVGWLLGPVPAGALR